MMRESIFQHLPLFRVLAKPILSCKRSGSQRTVSLALGKFKAAAIGCSEALWLIKGWIGFDDVLSNRVFKGREIGFKIVPLV